MKKNNFTLNTQLDICGICKHFAEVYTSNQKICPECPFYTKRLKFEQIIIQIELFIYNYKLLKDEK